MESGLSLVPRREEPQHFKPLGCCLGWAFTLQLAPPPNPAMPPPQSGRSHIDKIWFFTASYRPEADVH
jgi:hypothetical protein